MFLRLAQGPVEPRAENFVLPTMGLMPQPLSGPLTITESTILSIPAAYRCIQIISDSIASLPIHAFRNGKQIVYASLPTTKKWLADNKWQTAKPFAMPNSQSSAPWPGATWTKPVPVSMSTKSPARSGTGKS